MSEPLAGKNIPSNAYTTDQPAADRPPRRERCVSDEPAEHHRPEPRFRSTLHVGTPNIGDHSDFLRRVQGALDRRWLTNDGVLVAELEARLAALLGVRHCIPTGNGTVGLELAIRAMGLSGEVIMPSFTFVAAAHALQWQQITPVFCDIESRNHSIDPACVERLITPRTSAILAVHLWGEPCDIAALTAIARKHRLRLLFDAAHAFGCSHDGTMIGNFGDAEVFSFHATKVFNTIEGGAITTNDDELAARLRAMRNFGFTDYDKVDYLGTNGKMNEMEAAMGLTNLEHLAQFIAVNRRNYLAYRQGLADIPGVRMFEYRDDEKRNHQYIVIEVTERSAGISRDRLLKTLHQHNVLARRYFWPGCHRMQPYASYQQPSPNGLLVTERVASEVLCLPTGTAVSEETVAAICQLIRSAAATPSA